MDGGRGAGNSPDTPKKQQAGGPRLGPLILPIKDLRTPVFLSHSPPRVSHVCSGPPPLPCPSPQTSSATEDDSETQAPVLEHSSVENRTLSSRNQQQDRDRTPSSMPPPRGAAPGRRHTPEGSATTVNRNDGRDFATPPIPKSSTQ